MSGDGFTPALATRAALGRLDEFAEEWAATVTLDGMVSAIALKDDAETRFTMLIKQAYVEGCYRAYSEGAPAARAIARADAQREHDGRVAELLAANNREVERRRAAEAGIFACLHHLLADYYGADEAETWLSRPQPGLEFRCPRDLVAAGRTDEVLRLLARLRDGGYL